MKAFKQLMFMAMLSVFAPTDSWSHCEVPCGIYGDSARFSAMSEDVKTIEKAMISINNLSKNSDALSMNQLNRWVDTKEVHANRIQRTVSQYFMTQRLKAPSTDDDDEKISYRNQLEHLHRILRSAMQCKQTVKIENAHELQKLIDEFQVLYND